jgi:hypothetical protein
MMNRGGAHGFTEDEKMLVRELFGVRPGEGKAEELRRCLVEEIEKHIATLMRKREKVDASMEVAEIDNQI